MSMQNLTVRTLPTPPEAPEEPDMNAVYLKAYEGKVDDLVKLLAKAASSKDGAKIIKNLPGFEGKNAVMPTIVRTADSPYQWEIGSIDLKDVANVEKMMPPEFISPDGFGITLACRTYLEPLIAGEDYPPYKNGLPDYVVLKNQLVTKKLPEFNV